MSPRGALAELPFRTGLHRRLDLSPEQVQEARSPRLVARVALLVIAIGMAWRLARYALCFPIWGDEAMLCFNFVERGFADLLRPLEYDQVAPLLFLIAEWASYHGLGNSEYALRLLPLLASCLSVPLLWFLARTMLPANTAWLVTAILSVSIWPVSMGSLVKPYSGDLFWALALLVPGARLLRDPLSGKWWFALIVLAPMALLASFPAVFIGGAVAIALLPVVWKEKSPRTWTRFIFFGTSLAATFCVHYFLVMRHTSPETRETMEWYWREGFPPGNPWLLPLWLLQTHAGQMFAYPLGAARGGSSLTLIFTVLGILALWRGHRSTLLLLLSPFALSMGAAFLRSYPYGHSGRLAQHLAPSVCILTAAGIVSLLQRSRFLAWREKANLLLLVALATLGLAGIVRDVLKPYRSESDLWARKINQEIARNLRPNDRIFAVNSLDRLEMCFRWYLHHLSGDHPTLTDANIPALCRLEGSIWCIDLQIGRASDWQFQKQWPELEGLNAKLPADVWIRQPHHEYDCSGRSDGKPLLLYCGIHIWTRKGSPPLKLGALR